MIFFLLILTSFASTESITRKSLFRYNKTRNANGPYSRETYVDSGAFVEDEKILEGLIASIQNIWKAMLTGDYTAQEYSIGD